MSHRFNLHFDLYFKPKHQHPKIPRADGFKNDYQTILTENDFTCFTFTLHYLFYDWFFSSFMLCKCVQLLTTKENEFAVNHKQLLKVAPDSCSFCLWEACAFISFEWQTIIKRVSWLWSFLTVTFLFSHDKWVRPLPKHKINKRISMGQRFCSMCNPLLITVILSPVSVKLRAQLCLLLWHRQLHVLLLPWKCCGARLRQDCFLSGRPRLQEWHRGPFPSGGHLDHLYEGPAQLLTAWRDPVQLQWAAGNLLSAWARAPLWDFHH